MILEIESVSPTACRINGWLLDINLLKHWFESRSWSAHTPGPYVRRLEIFARDLSGGKHTVNAYGLLRLLSYVNNYGFRVPDEAFARPWEPGSDVRFRRDSEGGVIVEKPWRSKYGGYVIEMKGDTT